MPSPPVNVGEVSTVRSFIRSAGQILLSCYHEYLINGLNNLDETYKEYSIVSTDDQIGF